MSSDPEGAGTAGPGQSDVSTGEGGGASPKADAGDKGRADRARERFRGLPTHTFGPASEEPYRRRTSDWVRVAVAVVAPRGCSSPTTTIRATRIRTCSGSSTASPTISSPSSRRCTGRGRSGLSWSSPRPRSSAVAGGWLAISRSPGCLPRSWPGRWPSSSTTSRCRRRSMRSRASAKSPQFPLVRLAIVAAVVAAASPYVTRPTRRLGQLLVFALAFSAMYLGTGYPSDILASAVPRVGCRRARASRVRVAGRASDDATGRGIACGARGGGTRRASGSDTTDRRVAVPRAGRSGPVVDPCHRSRRGRQPVLREVVALRGLQGFRSGAVPDPRAGRGARGLPPAARRTRSGASPRRHRRRDRGSRALRSSWDARRTAGSSPI